MIFKKKIKLTVLAISLGTAEDRIKLGIKDTRTAVFRIGMEVEYSQNRMHFGFLPAHITTIMSEHPCIGDVYSITFEKEGDI